MTKNGDVFTKIVEPGLYESVPEAEYHADPVEGGSLSSTGIRQLLDAPARYFHAEPVQKDAYNFGSVVHELVLGAGAGIVEIDAENYRKKATQEVRDAAYEEGKTPILVGKLVEAKRCYAALRNHRQANRFLFDDSAPAVNELTAVWEGEVWGRARFDRFVETASGPLIVDLKTTRDAAPSQFGKTATSYGYHHQAAWYIEGAAACGYPDARFIIVAVEKAAPYLVSVHEFSEETLFTADRGNRLAVQRLLEAQESGVWAGYPPKINQIGLRPWDTLY